ncbi:MAG: hypothetical protein NTW87_17860 [Planctomycetota bacterium]|nr:hypothetical protein [Planctomycetota bacterium]
MAWILVVLSLVVAYIAIWRTRSPYGDTPFTRSPFRETPFSRPRRRSGGAPKDAERPSGNDPEAKK